MWLRLPFVVAAAALGLLAMTHSARAGSLHHVALLVEHSSGRFLTRCLAFVEDQITGYQLVERSGVQYQAQQFGSMGNAICQLDGEPTPVPSNCFGSGAYWQYFHRTPTGWQQSGAGASSSILHDGDTDGWRYAASAGQPPGVTFASVCGQASSVATPVASRVTTAPAPAATAPPRTPVSTSTPAATSSTSPSLEAMAPSATPTSKTALATTGPSGSGPPPPSSMLPWLLLGIGSSGLIALGAINFLRRAP